MRTLLLALLLAPALVCTMPLAAWAAGGGYRLDRAPIDPTDLLGLQSGARTFVNYCLNCHGAQYMRYNRLTDLGLTEAQIRDNLVFTGDKVGETMVAAMDSAAMRKSHAPPSVRRTESRSRGTIWGSTIL